MAQRGVPSTKRASLVNTLESTPPIVIHLYIVHPVLTITTTLQTMEKEIAASVDSDVESVPSGSPDTSHAVPATVIDNAMARDQVCFITFNLYIRV